MKVIDARRVPVGKTVELGDLKAPVVKIFASIVRNYIYLVRRISEGQTDRMHAFSALKSSYGSYRLARQNGCLDDESVKTICGRAAGNLDQVGAEFLTGFYKNVCVLPVPDSLRLLKMCEAHSPVK